MAMENLLATLRAFENVLKQDDISVASSTEYCDNFCQALMHYAGTRNSMDHGLPLLEVYCVSISCFAAARSHLTAESDRVALVLKRLALSCFELFLSVPEHEIPFEAWLQFHQYVQLSHDSLLAYGSTDLQALLQMTGEGGAWCNPVLTSLLTGQPTDAEEVDAYISLEGDGFMEMRVKHLEKIGEVAKAVVLAKACSECNFISNKSNFRQTYVSLLCHLLPSEEALTEISRLDCKDVLEITCNLETEGDENTAFILCTTFLTQQLQQQSQYCSWELIVLWSKLQRKLDPTILSFLDRCCQLGAIAKTVCHLLYLVRVIQSEVEDLGVAPSVELCVKALQLPKQDDSDTRISVCKTISSLLADDLEVCRACLLTEFLLSPNQEVFRSLEELYLRPDHKSDLENVVIPNSLRCELLLALKSYWPFDPEFWDWKTLKHQCVSLLGLKPESEEDDDEDEGGSQEKSKLTESQAPSETSGIQNGLNGIPKPNELKKHNSDSSEIQKPSKSKKSKLQCKICERFVADAQLLHHSKRHSQTTIHPCPICLKRFNTRKELVPHLKLHTESAVCSTKNNVKSEQDQKYSDDEEDIEPGEINVDPSLMMYYKSTHDPDVLHHIVQQANNVKKHVDEDEHITFDYISKHYNLQNRDEYVCPGTGCAKVFKHSKYLHVHLKSEHMDDENVKHFQKMRDIREKCSLCRKHLMSAYHFRKHRKRHSPDLPYTCLVVGCGAQFRTSNEFGLHKQTHGFQLNYQCELKGCHVTFPDLAQVYHHEAEHFRDAAFTCTAPKCTKYYLSKTAFNEHLSTHNICFTERDFEAQRKAKRKRFKSSITEASPCQIRPNNSPALNGNFNKSHFTSLLEPAQSSEAKTTLVAVCFDGSKFTCGFEKCGMTFSRARDVQRHLKCAHPEHLKMESKEHKHDRERGFNSKAMKVENNASANKKAHKKSKVPSVHIKTKNEHKASPHGRDPETSGLHEALKEIVNGLCKLDLNRLSPQTEPPQLSPKTDPSEMSLHRTIMEKPVVAALQKKSVDEDKKMCKNTPQPDREECQDILANYKPFICDEKSCDFKTKRAYSLQRHYTTVHQRSLKSCQKLSLYKPFICNICLIPHNEVGKLRNHYIQAHGISESQVDKMKCGRVKNGRNKTTERPSPQFPHSQRSMSKETELLQLLETDSQNDSETSEKEQDDMKVEKNDELKVDGEAEATHQGRAKRAVGKGNLCYILDRFSKPFHCVAKNCDAAFSTQAGLVRHLQIAHHYNRSQLLLENEDDEQGAEAKKEHPKKRSLPNSDEPQPQYKCQFANCKASFHLKSSLARHTRDCHSHPDVLQSKYKSPSSPFSHDSEHKNRALYNHSEYYDSVVVRLQSTQKNSLTGCQKKLIISSQSPQKEEADPANTQKTKQVLMDSGEPEQSQKLDQNVMTLKSRHIRKLVFKSHEEALQMCQDRCVPEAFPCLVQNCDTVVQCKRSLPRHYYKVHHMRRCYINKERENLVLNAEQLEELIQRKSIRSTGVSCPNGVLKMEYQAEAENSGDQSAPVSLHNIKTETQGETPPDPQPFPVEKKEEKQPSVERNGVLVGADEVLYGEPTTVEQGEEPVDVKQNCQKQEERLSLEQIKPFLRPVTVDLSPPSSLRFITEKGFVELSNKDKAMIKETLKNRRLSVSIPRIREPLKRKNDLSEQPSKVRDSAHNTNTKSFDIKLYKPVGFESSFLKFISDNRPKGKTIASSKRQNSHKRSWSVKENNQLGKAHTRRRTQSPMLKPHAVSGITSIKNLKLDKVLAGCGDLAIKQLQYLKPVVVLYRRISSTTLPDHNPAEIHKSKLLLGS